MALTMKTFKGAAVVALAAGLAVAQTPPTTPAPAPSYQRAGQIPARMGYLIGYEIARRTAATHQITELARLRGRPLLNLVRRETENLAAGGGSQPK